MPRTQCQLLWIKAFTLAHWTFAQKDPTLCFGKQYLTNNYQHCFWSSATPSRCPGLYGSPYPTVLIEDKDFLRIPHCMTHGIGLSFLVRFGRCGLRGCFCQQAASAHLKTIANSRCHMCVLECQSLSIQSCL